MYYVCKMQRPPTLSLSCTQTLFGLCFGDSGNRSTSILFLGAAAAAEIYESDTQGCRGVWVQRSLTSPLCLAPSFCPTCVCVSFPFCCCSLTFSRSLCLCVSQPLNLSFLSLMLLFLFLSYSVLDWLLPALGGNTLVCKHSF